MGGRCQQGARGSRNKEQRLRPARGAEAGVGSGGGMTLQEASAGRPARDKVELDKFVVVGPKVEPKMEGGEGIAGDSEGRSLGTFV